MPFGRTPFVIINQTFDCDEDELREGNDVSTSRIGSKGQNCLIRYSSSFAILDNELEKDNIWTAAQEDERDGLYNTRIHLLSRRLRIRMDDVLYV